MNVVKGSPSILRIRNLSNEIGDTIYVNEIEKYGSEQLIAMVAHGDIDYAVCDEGIARMAVDSLPQLDINTAISFTQFYSWGVSKQSPALLDSLNTWLSDFRKKENTSPFIANITGNNNRLSSLLPSLLKIAVTSCTTGTVRVEQLVVYELYNSSCMSCTPDAITLRNERERSLSG